MPASTEPRFGLFWGWSYGENGWKAGMDQNLLRLGRFGVHLSVLDRDVADPTTLTPEEGDTYIVADSAVDAWAGWEGRVVYWDDNDEQWINVTPRVGWVAYIEDEEVLCVYKAAGWSTGVSL